MAQSAKVKKNEIDEPLEKKLWKAADKLRKNMDAAEYKHIAYCTGPDLSEIHLRCF